MVIRCVVLYIIKIKKLKFCVFFIPLYIFFLILGESSIGLSYIRLYTTDYIILRFYSFGRCFFLFVIVSLSDGRIVLKIGHTIEFYLQHPAITYHYNALNYRFCASFWETL